MNIDKAGYCIFMRFSMFPLYVLFVFIPSAVHCVFVFGGITAMKRNKILIDFITFCSIYRWLSVSLCVGVTVSVGLSENL